MNDDISSDVSTLAARFSSGRPLTVWGGGGGGTVIVAKNDSRSRFMRFVLFLMPLSSTESADKRGMTRNPFYGRSVFRSELGSG